MYIHYSNMSNMNKMIYEINNIDYVKYFNDIRRKRMIYDADITEESEHKNIFGYFSGYDSMLNTLYKGSYEYGISPAYIVYVKCGVEVLKIKPHTTATGKTTLKGWSVGDMKKCLKNNGIKGYSKMNKTDIIDLLIKM